MGVSINIVMNKLVCAVSKCEIDLDCWIDYYLAAGFDIAILDENDKPIIQKKERIKVYRGLKFIFEKTRQTEFYNFILKKTKYDWVALLDCDEYLVWKDDLDYILKSFKNYGAVCPNWLNFGSNGHIEKPSGRVFENFTKRSRTLDKTFKSIVQAKYYISNGHSHYVKSQRPCFTTQNQFVDNWWQTRDVTDNDPIIWINHYCCKSIEHWKNKISRGQILRKVHLEEFKKFDTNEVEDLRCKKLYEKLIHTNPLIKSL
jgi:hypothetical protein